MSDATPALDEAFERMAAASFELPNEFVNHGPAAMAAGKAGSQPAGRGPGRRSIVRVLPQVCEVDAVDGTRLSRHGRGFRYDPDRLIRG